ncbi:MAG: nucleoside deaminase [Rhizobiales bacterium]|nr:nucleoside deaminase [Hyphomicrobiales bacterium]
MPVDPRDKSLLARAVALSREHMEQGAGGPFGAVIASTNGRIIAEGWNCVTSQNDPTAHAEITAIRRACETIGSFDLAGHVIYSSCEPCPMCLAAIYWARLERLVFANSRDEAAAIGFDDAAIYAEIPKPLSQRSIPTLHQPSDEAARVFADWLKKPDRVEY